MPVTPAPPSGIKVEGVDTDTESKAPRGRPRSSKRADPSPKVDAPKPTAGTQSEVTPAKVEQAFAEILSLPALAYKVPGTPWQCDFCAKHFASQGPVTAKELVEQRSNYPALYAAMEKIAAAWTAISLAPTIVGYVGVPVIHHGPSVLQPLAPVFGVPARPVTPTIPGSHPHGTAATAGTARTNNSGDSSTTSPDGTTS